MQLTISEALSMEPLNRAKLLAGEGGLDNVITSVNVMEVPDILDYINEGELLVTTMYPLKDDKAGIESLIISLHNKKLAGLAIKPHRYIGDIPKQMIDDANQLNFPLIELPPEISFVTIIHPLLSRILDLKTNELIQSQEIHRQFLDIVLNGGGFNEIANSLTKLIHLPITIVDRFNKILGKSSNVVELEYIDDFIENDLKGDAYLSINFAPQQFIDIEERNVHCKELIHGGNAINIICCPIKLGNNDLGEVIVWDVSYLDLDSVDFVAIEHVTTIGALKMMELRSIHQVEQRIRNEILESLLSGNLVEIETAIEKMRQFCNTINSKFVLLQVGPNIPDIKSFPQEKHNILDDILYSVRRYIRGINPDYLYWYQGSRLVVYFPLTDNKYTGNKFQLLREMESICNKIKLENNEVPIAIGISDTKHDLHYFKQAYYNALQSQEIGRIMNYGLDDYCVSDYDSLGIFRIISLNTGRDSLYQFCDDILGEIIQYDQQNGAELLQTLQVFLTHNQNATKAAEALYIHYNTLRYRLERIRDIIGDSLEQPQRRLAIEVALTIYPFLRGN